jgi:hypothetical protein
VRRGEGGELRSLIRSVFSNLPTQQRTSAFAVPVEDDTHYMQTALQSDPLLCSCWASKGHAFRGVYCWLPSPRHQGAVPRATGWRCVGRDRTGLPRRRSCEVGSRPGVKQPGRESDHSPPYRAEARIRSASMAVMAWSLITHAH